jgi:hypothetical protein
MALPGDAVAGGPAVSFTRAITVDAPPSAVWPWLVQIGQDRAGFYSNTWLENLTGADIHNAAVIRPDWQRRAAGDAVPMARPDLLGGGFANVSQTRIWLVEPERALADTPTRFVLRPAGDRTTRLLLRERVIPGTFARWIWDPMHFVMEQRMLRGIKERAEGRPLVPAPVAAAGRIGWVVAGIAVGGLFLSRRRWLPLGVLAAAAMVPPLASTGDVDAALTGFLALGISLLGFLAWGRRWLAPYVLLSAAVLLVLLLAPDAYTAFGLSFGLIAVTAVVVVIRTDWIKGGATWNAPAASFWLGSRRSSR